MVRPMKINGTRLLNDLFCLREFTDTPGEGVTRFSYGEMDRRARAYLYARAEDLGCAVEEDALRNVRIRMPQNKPGRKRVVIGSHVDTVRNGGWLDGVYGVTGGLEVLRCLKDAELKTNLELVIFAEEEGSNFGSTMTGSKFIAGDYTQKDLDRLVNDQGKTLRTVLGNPAPEAIQAVPWDFSQIAAMLELHIEQGPVLEKEGLSLGIVDTIFGMKVIEAELVGVGNHAGAAPMEGRRDALCAAAECVLAAERISREDSGTVATIGRIRVEPDCSNVIPEKAIFSLEVRNRRMDKIEDCMNAIKMAIANICKRRQIECQTRERAASNPLRLDESLIEEMDALAREKRIPHRIMDSGAVHDACMIAKHAPAGMIFVPSIGGRSHVPEEDTSQTELIQGVQFLLELVKKWTVVK